MILLQYLRQFGIPEGTARHTSKRLVQHCKYAIFEASIDARYFFEMEDTEEFSCLTLCLWEASHGSTPMVSEMTRMRNTFRKSNKFCEDISEVQARTTSSYHTAGKYG